MATALDLLLVRGDKALHLQLADQIQDRILSGNLASGAKLPTIRDLAAGVKVSRVTALQAYETLQARGLVECKVGSGTYVTTPADRKNGRERLRSFSACTVRTDFTSTAQSSGITNLTTSDADDSLFHSDEFVAGMLRRADGHASEAGLYGFGPLLTALLGFYETFGVHGSLETLQVTGGGAASNAILADQLGQSGARIVLQDPCFPFAYDYFQSFKTEPIGVRTVNGELDTDQFRDVVKGGDVKAAFLTLTANQATGESASAANKRQVIAIAEKYGVALWEDVSGFWVCNPGERTPWLWELSEGATVDVCAFDCMTKTLSPQVPVSAFFARGRTRDRAAVRSLGYGSAPSAMVQKALTSFIQSRAMAAHLARNLARYQARRQAVVNALSEYMPPECSWSTPRTGFCLWLSFPEHIDDTGVYEAALSAGVGVSPGIASAVPRRPVSSVRLAYSCAAVDEIAIAIRRLAQIISARLS